MGAVKLPVLVMHVIDAPYQKRKWGEKREKFILINDMIYWRVFFHCFSQHCLSLKKTEEHVCVLCAFKLESSPLCLKSFHRAEIC